MKSYVSYTLLLSLGGLATMPGCNQAQQPATGEATSVPMTGAAPVSLTTLSLAVSGMS